MSANGQPDRLRLLRDIGQAEKELDKAMMLLDRTQRAMVDVGSHIMALHAAMLEMRRMLEIPQAGARDDRGGRGPGGSGKR